jgi:hypothetical protein
MQSLIMNGDLYLSGDWLGVDLSKNTKKHMCWKGIGVHANIFIMLFKFHAST